MYQYHVLGHHNCHSHYQYGHCTCGAVMKKLWTGKVWAKTFKGEIGEGSGGAGWETRNVVICGSRIWKDIIHLMQFYFIYANIIPAPCVYQKYASLLKHIH